MMKHEDRDKTYLKTQFKILEQTQVYLRKGEVEGEESWEMKWEGGNLGNSQE